MPPRKFRRKSKLDILPEARGRYKVSPKQDRTVDGIVFDSKWEARVFSLLRAKISKKHLHLQPKFLLQAKFRDTNGKMIREINYVADFLLGPVLKEDELPDVNKHFILDAKGHLTEIYKLKEKLFLYKYRTPIFKIKKLSDVSDIIDRYNTQYNLNK